MNNLLASIEQVTLMGPGPSCISDEVFKAMALPTLGHMDKDFILIMDGIKEMLQKVMATKNRLTVPVSGTGSAGMETCFVNLIEPGDAVLILKNGVFGNRMFDVASRLGAQVDAVDAKWGTPILIDSVKEQLAKKPYKIVAIVHAETSTGVLNPIREIGNLVHQNGALYLVDAVTSLGGIPVPTDEIGIDALYSGSQKCLSCPPGLSPVSFSDRAVHAITNRRKKVPNWYLDMNMIIQYWHGANRVYHHTAPINMLYGLYQSLYLILEEGLEAVYQRHMKYHTMLVSELESMGLQMLVKSGYRLPMLNAVIVPDSVNEVKIRNELRNTYHIEIGAGLGDLAGKIFRIGLMGHTAREENVIKIVSALKKLL
ncbi:MAG: alanine--glyoxylate aminotransferase family protein [Sphaerochaetaceae bacterium]|nr:alanine--glyoxylate aminotransferase family protein [Sphaerochaetaceae bacterium]